MGHLFADGTVFESTADMFLRIPSDICPQFDVHIRYHLKFTTTHDEGTHSGGFNSAPNNMKVMLGI